MNDPHEHNSQSVFGKPINDVLKRPSSLRGKRIIKNDAVAETIKKTLIGGNNPDDCIDPPSIRIERSGDTILKIVVTCPCGRYSEIDFSEET